ncbi:MAG TPA: altronate dehydratase family protein [Acidobacteriaceae bacterium]|jgi:altronate hydrolase|nr:altronate dehydratase family protein [Acidobacteriaceae bacterium]
MQSAASHETVETLDAFTITVNSADNVAVARRRIETGTQFHAPDGAIFSLSETVPPGHRIAVIDIPQGEFVRQYGQPIGTSLGIHRGDKITHANMSNEVPIQRDLNEDQQVAAPEYFSPQQAQTFSGYRRADGRVGTRNYILIVPTSMCSSHEAAQISMQAEFELYSRSRFPNVDGVVAIPHNKGCGCQDGSNIDIALRTLSNYAAHPNVGGVVMLDLGCEKTNLSVVEKYLLRTGETLSKPFVKIGVQESGGTSETILRGLAAVKEMLPVVNQCERTQVPLSELVLGVKCGGSDGLSGLSANPSLGKVSDRLVRFGGTVLMTEVPEFFGAEHLLAARAKDAATARSVYAMVDWYRDFASRAGAVLNENPSPGNVAGGLLNIAIKSLGAIAKGGHTRVEGVTGYAEPPKGHGLQLMQGPGYDQESTPGLVAAGATVVIFTTGRGTTIGNAIAPVIKLASNNDTFRRMQSDIDLSAGNVVEGTETMDQVGERVFDYLVDVASGATPAKAETHKHREFQIWAETAVSL